MHVNLFKTCDLDSVFRLPLQTKFAEISVPHTFFSPKKKKKKKEKEKKTKEKKAKKKQTNKQNKTYNSNL